MLRHFYRFMVVALGLFLASSCGKSTPLYGIEETDFDDGALDEEVVDEDAVESNMTDRDQDIPDTPSYGSEASDYQPDGDAQFDEDAPPDDDAVDAEGFDSESEIPDEDGDEPEFEDTLYGCPSTEYHIAGTVTSAENIPIAGLKVEANMMFGGNDIQYTDASGNFEFSKYVDCGDPAGGYFQLTVSDIDGSTNGSYQGQVIDENMDCTNTGGSFGHYDCVKTDIEIKLEEVSSDDDTLVND